MSVVVNKTVKLKLEGLDGNAFNLLGQFQKQAKKEGWTKEEINDVIIEAQKGDYEHLLQVLMDHSEIEEFNEDELFLEDENEED